MTYQLKTISTEAIPEATAKADWYRLLNEPGEAESICRDVLAVDPAEQTALRLLGLAITDQFTGAASDRRAEPEATFQTLRDCLSSGCTTPGSCGAVREAQVSRGGRRTP